MDYSNLVSFHDNGQKPSTRCSFNPISLSRSESFELRFENLRSPSQKNARWKWARFTSRFFLPTSKIKSLRKFRNDRRETFFFFFFKNLDLTRDLNSSISRFDYFERRLIFVHVSQVPFAYTNTVVLRQRALESECGGKIGYLI